MNEHRKDTFDLLKSKRRPFDRQKLRDEQAKAKLLHRQKPVFTAFLSLFSGSLGDRPSGSFLIYH